MSGGAIVQPQSKTAVAEEQLVRYTFQERVIHWVNGVSYGYLLFTGLAIFTPYLAWMGTVMRSADVTRLRHEIENGIGGRHEGTHEPQRADPAGAGAPRLGIR